MITDRDDFLDTVKRLLAARVASRCSNPDCRASTSGPQIDPAKALNVGVAAHITAAAPGRARFDPALTPAQRGDIENGIWLCQTCAKLVDNDATRFTGDVLREWKSTAEQEALDVIGKTATKSSGTTEIIDKWVSFGYEHKSTLSKKLAAEGYELGWISADKEAEKIEFEGWEYVLVDQSEDTKARLKIHDHPVIGGYLILLKRRKR